MSKKSRIFQRLMALRVIFIYAVVGTLWIYFSDSLLSVIVTDREMILKISIYKGIFYVLFTSTLLYGLIEQYTRSLEKDKIVQTGLEARFRSIMELSPDIISILDEQGLLIFNSPAALRIHGYTESEMLNRNTLELIHPDDQVAIQQKMVEVMRNPGTVITVEYRYRHKNGTYTWMEAAACKPVDNPLISGMIAISRDISVRKKAEANFKAVLEFLPVAVVVGRADGQLEFINRHFTELFGYTLEDVPNIDRWFEAAYPSPEYRKELREIWEMESKRAMLAGQPMSPRDVRVTTRDGRVLNVISYNLIQEDRVIGILTDITEREKHQEGMIRTQKLESLGLLAGGIAHDFNNILTGILGNVSFAKVLIGESHKAFATLQAAEQAAVRAASLSSQLLTFSRGGAPVLEVVDCGEILRESLSLGLVGRNIQTKVNIMATLSPVMGDGGQLHQVFTNLFINAAQSMPDGGTIQLKAENTSLDGKKWVSIVIEDTGCGISSENISKIFDPYFTTKVNGVGMGLATTYSIVHKHGGKITVESVMGKGTQFTVLLPQASVSSIHASSKKKNFNSPTNAIHGATILVMDDEEMIRTLCQRMLETLGYQVATCSNGAEAIEMYKKMKLAGHPYSAVIMDLTVPNGMGGKDAAAQIMELDPSAKLIVSSGYSTDPIISDLKQFGFTASIVKPYRINEMASTLGTVLRKDAAE